MRTVKVDLYDILDLVNCADTYGFNDDVLMSAFGEWTGKVENEEIEKYASFFISDEGFKKGYFEEDKNSSIQILTEWRDKYCDKN